MEIEGNKKHKDDHLSRLSPSLPFYTSKSRVRPFQVIFKTKREVECAYK